jgi:hypothetical protein
MNFVQKMRIREAKRVAGNGCLERLLLGCCERFGRAYLLMSGRGGGLSNTAKRLWRL